MLALLNNKFYNKLVKELNQTISNNLVLLRKKYGYKQSDVAQKINYSDKTVSKWETGELVPSVENLIELCSLYNVTLDEITKPISEDSIQKSQQKDYSQRNKVIIALLSIMAVWVFATIVFVYADILSGYSAWRAFVWAVPASCIVGIVFNSLWGKFKLNYVYISILLWSLITSFYLEFIQYNLIALYFLGIPAQIAILLWSGLKKNKNN